MCSLLSLMCLGQIQQHNPQMAFHLYTGTSAYYSWELSQDEHQICIPLLLRNCSPIHLDIMKQELMELPNAS